MGAGREFALGISGFPCVGSVWYNFFPQTIVYYIFVAEKGYTLVLVIIVIVALLCCRLMNLFGLHPDGFAV